MPAPGVPAATAEAQGQLPATEPGLPDANMTTTAPEIRKFEFVDILRGLAIVAVIAVHSEEVLYDYPVSAGLRAVFHFGQLGVQLFFVASAITLCLSMAARHQGAAAFFVRRFFRIAPLYYLAAVVYFGWYVVRPWLAHHAWDLPFAYSMEGLAENLVFLHGLDPRNFNGAVPGGWSISTEVQFYAVFPLLYGATCAMSNQRFLRASVLLVLTVLLTEVCLRTFLASALGLPAFDNDEWGFYYCLLFNQIGVFLIGMLAYRHLGRPVPGWAAALSVTGLVFCIWMLNDHDFDTGYDGLIYANVAAAAFAVFAVWLSAAHRQFGALGAALAEIGRKSYSIYLVHRLVLELFRYHGVGKVPGLDSVPDALLLALFVTTLAVSYGLAVHTGKWIEQPAIGLGGRVAARAQAWQGELSGRWVRLRARRAPTAG